MTTRSGARRRASVDQRPPRTPRRRASASSSGTAGVAAHSASSQPFAQRRARSTRQPARPAGAPASVRHERPCSRRSRGRHRQRPARHTPRAAAPSRRVGAARRATVHFRREARQLGRQRLGTVDARVRAGSSREHETGVVDQQRDATHRALDLRKQLVRPSATARVRPGVRSRPPGHTVARVARTRTSSGGDRPRLFPPTPSRQQRCPPRCDSHPHRPSARPRRARASSGERHLPLIARASNAPPSAATRASTSCPSASYGWRPSPRSDASVRQSTSRWAVAAHRPALPTRCRRARAPGPRSAG